MLMAAARLNRSAIFITCGVNCRNPEVQCDLVRNLQIYTAYMIDSTGFCLFMGPSVNRAKIVARLINSRYGKELTAADIRHLGRRVLKREQAFNRAAGVPDIDMAEMFRTQPLPPHNNVFDVDPRDMLLVHDFSIEYPEAQRAIF